MTDDRRYRRSTGPPIPPDLRRRAVRSPIAAECSARRRRSPPARRSRKRSATARAPSRPPPRLRFAPAEPLEIAGFERVRVKTSDGTTIQTPSARAASSAAAAAAARRAADARLVARSSRRELAKDYTVIAPDLRGYGDSSKPPDGDDHANYSKRAMALDQVEVMKHFGFDRFPVVGHDRGGRVAHRMALDHPGQGHEARRARHRADLLPLHARDDRVRAGLLPLVQLPARRRRARRTSCKAQNDAQQARATIRDPARVPAHARATRRTSTRCARTTAPARRSTSSTTRPISTRRSRCPLRRLWGERRRDGTALRRAGDLARARRRRDGKGLPGGHNLQEDAPEPRCSRSCTRS